MSARMKTKAVVRRFVDKNNDNLAPTDEFFATSCTYHNSSIPNVNDVASVKFSAMASSAFP